MQTVTRGGAGQLGVHDTGFHASDAIDRIDFDDPGETVEADEHHVVGQCASRETGAGTTWDKGGGRAGQLTDDGNQFVFCAGQDSQRWRGAVARQAISIKDRQLLAAFLHPLWADDRGECIAHPHNLSSVLP